MNFKKGSRTVRIDQAFGIDKEGTLFPGGLPLDVEGMNYSSSFLRRSTPEERAELGLEEVPELPAVNEDFYNPDGTPKEMAAIKEMLANRLASIRYGHEQGGMSYSFAGNVYRIATDDRSQSKIIAIRMKAFISVNYSVNWKTAEGFINLNAATIIGLSDAVAAFVQSCFDTEMVKLSEIEALSSAADAELYSASLNSGWPT